MDITITAPVCRFNKYGKAAIEVADRLIERGHNVHWRKTWVKEEYGNFKVRFPDALKKRFTTETIGHEIVFAPDSELPIPSCKPGFKAILATYECGWNEDCLRFNFTRLKLDGSITDNAVFTQGDRVNVGKRFGFAANLGAQGQKEFDITMSAWGDAFPNVPDVSLSVKVFPGFKMPNTGDNRVSVVEGWQEPYKLAEWYRSLDMFICASDNYSLMVEEADLCGVPTVARCSPLYQIQPYSKPRHTIPFMVDKMRLVHMDPAHVFGQWFLGVRSPLNDVVKSIEDTFK